MATHRSFLFPQAELGNGYLVLDSRESHHLVRVFRARESANVEVLDGMGTCFKGRLVTADAKAARIEIDSLERVEKARIAVTLVQAVPKGKAMDLILRTATQIGVSVVQPVFASHGEVFITGARLESKLDKWRLAMIEACKQCGVKWLPELAPPLTFEDWLDLPAKEDSLRLVASLETSRISLHKALSDASPASTIQVAVGPEGDFSANEYAQMRSAKFKSVRLGANVLRAETAAAYLLSVVDQISQK
jgi:16S rRNA (uracil1498-N3)-methyltransferase